MSVRNHFIPLNDNIDKLLAFAPSLDRNWRNGQRIKSRNYQIETIEVVNGLRDEGWKINGVYQTTDRNRRINNHFVKLNHPDFSMKSGNQTEGITEMNISNNFYGRGDLNMDLGMLREVCTNGLIAFDKIEEACTSVKHTELNQRKLQEIICGMNTKAFNVIQGFNKLKELDLTSSNMIQLANDASKLRDESFSSNQLLKVSRKEDAGNSLWAVYNRIQENLTQAGKIVDSTGKVLRGINSIVEDTRVNKELFQLVQTYA